jgi:hypothetical protein
MQLKETKVRDEAELEALLVSDPTQIEEGFKVLTHQRKTHGFKTLDILGVDSEGILTLIELKVVIDSGQLKQALLYYDWVLQQGIDWISGAYKSSLGNLKISERMPQIFLIAPDFDEEMFTEVKYVREDIRIRLFRYLVLELEDRKFVKLIEESISAIKGIESKPRSVQDIIDYINDKDVKKLFTSLIDEIKSIEKDIEEKPTEWNLTYWIKGRKFCDLYPRKQAFAVGYKTDTEKKWESVNNISSKDQVVIVLQNITKAFTLMKR